MLSHFCTEKCELIFFKKSNVLTLVVRPVPRVVNNVVVVVVSPVAPV